MTFNISNLGYERRLPPDRELLGARLPPSPVLSQPAGEGERRWPLGKWRKGNAAAEIAGLQRC